MTLIECILYCCMLPFLIGGFMEFSFLIHEKTEVMNDKIHVEEIK